MVYRFFSIILAALSISGCAKSIITVSANVSSISVSADASEPSTIQVSVQNKSGSGVPNAELTVSAQKGSVSARQISTDITGASLFSYTPPNQAGSYSIVVAYSSSVFLSIPVTVTPSMPATVTALTPSQNVTVGGSISLVSFFVTDLFGNTVPNTAVSIDSSNPLFTISNQSLATDQNGVVEFTVSAPTVPTSTNIKVSSVSLTNPSTSITINSVVSSPSTLTFRNYTQTTSVAGQLPSMSLGVLVMDIYGNPIDGLPLVWSISGGGTLSDQSTSSIADGTSSNTYTLQQTSGISNISVSVSGYNQVSANVSHQVTPSIPAALVFLTQPNFSIYSGIAFQKQPVIEAIDQYANETDMSTSVTISVFTDSSCSSQDAGTITGNMVLASTEPTVTFTALTYSSLVSTSVYLKAGDGSISTDCIGPIAVVGKVVTSGITKFDFVEGQSVNLSTVVSGGIPPYSYEVQSNTSNTSNPSKITQSGIYTAGKNDGSLNSFRPVTDTVVIKDSSGYSAYAAQVNFTLHPPVTIKNSFNPMISTGVSLDLNSAVMGYDPSLYNTFTYSLIKTDTSTPQSALSGINNHTYIAGTVGDGLSTSTDQITFYNPASVGANPCPITACLTRALIVSPGIFSSPTKLVFHSGSTEGVFSVFGGTPPYSVSLDTSRGNPGGSLTPISNVGSGFSSFQYNTPATISGYIAYDYVKVTDATGISYDLRITILPPAGTWTTINTSTAPTGRFNHGVVWDSDREKIVIYGGNGQNGLLSDGSEFDYSHELWSGFSMAGSSSVPLSNGLAGFVSYYSNGQMNIIAGTGTGTAALSLNSIDTTTKAGSARQSPAGLYTGSPVSFSSYAVSPSNQLVVIGGATAQSDGSLLTSAASLLNFGFYCLSDLSTCTQYGASPTSTSGQFTSMASNGPNYVDRAGAGSGFIGDYMYLFGGYSNLNSVYINDLWYQKDDSFGVLNKVAFNGLGPSARALAAVAATSNALLVSGGVNSTGILGDTMIYYPDLGSWTTLSGGDGMTARKGMSATWTGSQVFLFGGKTASSYDNGAWVYTP
jgi:hypothetical protein